MSPPKGKAQEAFRISSLENDNVFRTILPFICREVRFVLSTYAVLEAHKIGNSSRIAVDHFSDADVNQPAARTMLGLLEGISIQVAVVCESSVRQQKICQLNFVRGILR